MRKFYKQGSSGQVLLIVVVVMVVALTIGLSVASRTITNLKLSKQNEDAQKAFQAASAGIDRYINQGNCSINPAACDPTSQTLTSSQFDTKVTEVQGTTLLLNNGSPVDQDRGIDVWLANYPNYTNPYYPGGGIISLYWGETGKTNCNPNAGNATSPAIQVVLLTGTTTAPVLTKYAYDTCATRRSNNQFNGPVAAGSYDIGGSTFLNRTTIFVSNGLIMKVIPIYNSAKIAVTGTIAFPPQGKVIESVGTAGDTKRKIIYYESYPQIPNEIFPYAILSQ